MRTTILLLSLVLLSNSFASASITTNLKYGSKGEDVTELQEYLIDKGFLSGSASGNFYALTRKAVIAYQTSVNLPATGYVGPMTRSVINTELDDVASTTDVAEVKETGTTTVAVKSIVDVCTNIEGIQSTVPTGMFMDSVRGCFTPQVQTTQTNYVPVQQTQTPTVPVVVTPQYIQVDFNSGVVLTSEFGQDSSRADLFLSNAQVNDKIITTFNGSTLEHTVTNSDFHSSGSNPLAYYNVATGLTPDTEYSYTVRVERKNGDTINYSVKTGTFKTLSN